MAREVKVALLGDASSLERAFKRSAAAGDHLGGRMGLLGRTGGAVGDLLGKGLRVGALGAAGGMVYATKIAGDYQQQLNIFRATANATGKQMKGVGELALKLGADVKLPATSAKDAAVAMTELAKGGLKVKDVMKAARGTIQLAAAANIDGAEAAALEANTLQAFGLKGSQAAKVADLLAASANATTGSMEDMGFALEHASVGAHALGIPVNDTVAALGEMFNAGIKGGTAGAALNVALTRLSAPTTKAAKALKDMGVNAFTSGGHFVGLGELTKRFSAATEDMTQKQKLSSLATIFGTRGMKAAQIILAGGIEKYNKMKQSVSEVGAAQKLSDARTKGFNGAMQGLKSTLETLAITLGTRVLPKASEFLRFLSHVAGASSLSVAIKIAWSGAQELAASVQKALLGSSDTVHIGGGSPHVVVDPGLITNLRTAISAGIASTDWSVVGNRIGAALGKAIKIGDDALNKILDSITAWVSSHRGKLADLGAQMLAAIVIKLTDPSFWAKHWDLAIGVALAVGPGKFAKLGGRIGEMIIKPLERLGALIGGKLAEAFLRAADFVGPKAGLLALHIIVILEKGITSGAKLIGSAAAKLGSTIVDKIGAGLNKLGFIAKVLISTALVQSIAAAAVAAYNAARNLGGRIISGVLDGLSGLGSALKNKIESTIGGVLHSLNIPGASPPEHAAAQLVGAPLGRGVILGFLAGSRDLPEKISAKLKSSLDSARARIDGLRASFSTAFGRLGTDAMSAFDATTTKKLDVIARKFEKWRDKATKDLAGAMGAIDASQGALTPSEQALQDLTGAHDQAGRNADLARGQADLAAATTPEEQAAAQKEIDDAVYNQRIFDLGVLAAAERAKKDADAESARSIAQAAYDQQNLDWDAQQAKEQLDLQSQRDLKKRHLEDMLTDLQANLDKHPKAWRKAHAKIMKMFEEDFGPDFQAAGANLGAGFRASLTEDFQVTAGLLGDIGSAILRVLSPENQAAVGAAAAAKRPKKLAAGGIVTSPTFALIGEAGPEAVIPLGRGGGGGGTTINVTVEGWVGNDQDIAEKIRNALIRTGRNTTRGALGGYA